MRKSPVQKPEPGLRYFWGGSQETAACFPGIRSMGYFTT